MKRSLALVGALAVVTIGVTATGSWHRGPQPAAASSHREAPFISKDPQADNTDVYAFVSPDKPNTVTLIANYIPLEEPAGGPNFNEFSEDVLYAIHVDNDGDGEEDISYEFRFDTRLRNPNTALYNTNQLTSPTDGDWSLPQTYTVTRVEGRHRERLGANLAEPPVNVGPRSTPNYDAIAAQAVYSLGGDRKVFAGQRDDPFFVDLGSIFDLGGLRPFNSAHVIPLPPATGIDAVKGFNTHTIAIQVPITDLTRDHKKPSGPDDPKAVIGVYASASRQQIRVLTRDGEDGSFGLWVQVSRLGNPLVNEVIIPLGRKDKWNREDPKDEGQFLRHYRNPELAGLINFLYPGLPDIPTTDRDDLVAVLLTGVPGLNFTGNHKADLLRLNMAIAPTAAVGAGNRLGVLAGDLAGFPNGRRLEDDIVDIEIRAVACGYGPILAQPPFNLCNLSPNNQLGDGVDTNDKPLLPAFPYVPSPHQGYNHTHD